MNTKLDSDLSPTQRTGSTPAGTSAKPAPTVCMTKWVPTTDLLQLRRLGKTLEELGELTEVCARCIIQGIDAIDPKTGVANRERLWKETADVAAQINCTIRTFDLPCDDIDERVQHKEALMAEWEAMFAPQPAQSQCAEGSSAPAETSGSDDKTGVA